jgi:hypothetical protein
MLPVGGLGALFCRRGPFLRWETASFLFRLFSANKVNQTGDRLDPDRSWFRPPRVPSKARQADNRDGLALSPVGAMGSTDGVVAGAEPVTGVGPVRPQKHSVMTFLLWAGRKNNYLSYKAKILFSGCWL